jgi:hypothetical protein
VNDFPVCAERNRACSSAIEESVVKNNKREVFQLLEHAIVRIAVLGALILTVVRFLLHEYQGLTETIRRFTDH